MMVVVVVVVVVTIDDLLLNMNANILRFLGKGHRGGMNTIGEVRVHCV